jgi:hypothetical protein
MNYNLKIRTIADKFSAKNIAGVKNYFKHTHTHTHIARRILNCLFI